MFRLRKRGVSHRQRAIHLKAKEIEAWLNNMEHYQPCPNQDCVAFRKGMLDLVGDIKTDKHLKEDKNA